MTHFNRVARLVAFAATGLLASACADNVGPLAPAQVPSTALQSSQASQSLGGLVSMSRKTRVKVLTRRVALSRDYLVSGEIGADGGSLEIAEAGVVITFPQNALSTRTRITMRALAGRTVAYEFEPHGLTFSVKPMIEQDLDKTNWKQVLSKGNVEGVYFADPSSLNRDLDEADADEFFVTTTKGEKTLSFTVPHFSGYLVSSARCMSCS